jgi:ferrous iron transport protein B
LAIPCSAQLGLILGLLASYPAALVIWCGVIGATFILAGSLAAKLVPGERPVFYMELPPLRIPNLSNVVTKSYTRMYWYFMEVLPLFVAASVVLWVGKMTGGFDWLLRVLEPVVHVLGLPGETAKIFVFGFFRRDYGAAGLYDLITTGFLNPQQLLITATVLTLFVPCIAQFAVMVKERGWLTALMIAGFVFPFAYCVGYMMYEILSVINIAF